MQKVFHFDSQPDAYVADAAVLCCFDHRINLVAQKFLKNQGITRPDWIIVAGGAKSPGSLKAAVEQVHAAIPGSQLRWLEGQTHNLAAEPAAAMAKEFFLGR